MFVKRFLEWIGIKQQLDARAIRAPFVNEGDIWWCSVGENIGIEVSGKGPTFTRPVLVLKKFENRSFAGIPLTTKPRTGSWYRSFEFKGICQTAMLSQIRFFSYKRLDKKMGELPETEYKKIKEAFLSLLRA